MDDLTLGCQPDLLLAGIPLFLQHAQVFDRPGDLFVTGLYGVDQLLAGDIKFRFRCHQLGFQCRLFATPGSALTSLRICAVFIRA